MENYRVDHENEDKEMVNEIEGKKDKIFEVQTNLEMRIRDLKLLSEIDEVDGPSSFSSTTNLRRSTSLPTPPATPDCGSSVATADSCFSTLTVDKGLLRLENTTRLLQQSANHLSEETEIELPMNHRTKKLLTKDRTPLPSYSESSRRAITLDYSQ